MWRELLRYKVVEICKIVLGVGGNLIKYLVCVRIVYGKFDDKNWY